jgi:HTH-type transcriptional repressor of NAD biosynthesis genes
MNKKSIGLVLGKFMPLHIGHVLLLEFSQRFVDELYVVVDNIPDSPISGKRRCEWINHTMPNAKVFYLPHPNPQAPNEDPDFWNIWKRSLQKLLPEQPDYLFASETYGFKLSETLGATFIPFDIDRKNISVTATQIRNNLYKYWDYLSLAAKQDYLLRICLIGPESSGKSTLLSDLSQHFKTIGVPEYARLYIEAKGNLVKEDMLLIAKGQLALENAMLANANRLLFCDTDPLVTSIWSKWLFNECSDEIIALTKRPYDLYLVTYPDLEWKPDQVRYLPNKSHEFFNDCVNTLESLNRNFVIIKGSGLSRLTNAIEAIDQFLLSINHPVISI